MEENEKNERFAYKRKENGPQNYTTVQTFGVSKTLLLKEIDYFRIKS